jgi:IclR family transcriptional regulator, acetate operon repressor
MTTAQTTSSTIASEPGGRIQSVSRAIRLLMLIASGATGGTAKELARAAGIATPTTHHLLSTLVHERMLAKESTARYVLGTKVAVLADALERAVTTPEYLLEPLRQLAATTGETSYVCSWRGGDIRVQASIEGHHPVRVSLPPAPYTDAHARATGKLLLAMTSEEARRGYLAAHPLRALTPRTITDPTRLEAEFEQIRGNGYAVDEEQFQPGVSCVAAPVIDEGVAVAAYSISVPSPRFAEGKLRLIDAVLSVAQAATSASQQAPARRDGKAVRSRAGRSGEAPQ